MPSRAILISGWRDDQGPHKAIGWTIAASGIPSAIAPSTNARCLRHWRFRFLFRVNNIPAIYTDRISRDAIASAQNRLVDAVLEHCVRDCRPLEHLRSARREHARESPIEHARGLRQDLRIAGPREYQHYPGPRSREEIILIIVNTLQEILSLKQKSHL